MLPINDSPSPHLSAEAWADRINEQTRKSVEAILDIGRMLISAKAELPRGEWGRLFDDKLIPHSIRTAQRLMAVAEHPQLSNATHASLLPPSWMTLYELTRVEPQQLEQALTDGRVTPTMLRKDVAALRTDALQPAAWLPADGHAAAADAEVNGMSWTAFVVPSVRLRDREWWYVIAVRWSDDRQGSGGEVIGTKRPFPRERITKTLRTFGFPIERATWETWPVDDEPDDDDLSFDRRWAWPQMLYESRAAWLQRFGGPDTVADFERRRA